MRVHCLQHVPFEGLAHIGHWFHEHGHPLNTTQLYNDDKLPPLDTFDVLIILGGPMGIHDDDQHPWLATERQFIRRAIDDGKRVLGICLGAQLIAKALGANVYTNTEKEIGWFGLKKKENANKSIFGQHLPQHFTALHWHGDTFDLPSGATHLLSSDVCLNQAFSYNDRVLALQFHLEMTPLSTRAIVNACAQELISQSFIQSAETINREKKYYESCHSLMEKLLAQLVHHTQ